MLFVIGGAYQGKTSYVKDRFDLTDADIFECSENGPLDDTKKVISHYERYVSYCLKNGQSPKTDFDKDAIVMMDDLSCGVVPVDADIRAYREAVGRAGCAVTRVADEVVRVFCGLPKVLKAKPVCIWLIRHGRTEATDLFRYCGKTDLPLTERGRQELEQKKKKAVYPDEEEKTVYVSSLCRTHETAAILFPKAVPVVDKDLDEMNFGMFENRTYAGDLESDPDFLRWTTGDNNANVCPNGESSDRMKKRVFAAFERILIRGEDSILVCHGGPIEALYSRYNPKSGLNFYQKVPKHGEGYLLELEGGHLQSCTTIAEKE